MENSLINSKKKIIHVDEDLCIGCGLCVNHCQGGALSLVNGKAKLMREDHCDYMGNCLPVCPTAAISFVDRDSVTIEDIPLSSGNVPPTPGCPGTMVKSIEKDSRNSFNTPEIPYEINSKLTQWPVQIQLVPEKADFFNNKPLVIAADCSAFAYGNFHNEFIKNSVVIIGCPKLDAMDYKDKLQSIIEKNDIKSLSIVRMEVPCCGGIEHAAKEALKDSGKFIPWNVFTISIDGKIL